MGRENNLLILGAGQYGCVAKETAEIIGCYDKISFIDNNSSLAIGKTDELEAFLVDYANAFVAIGNAQIRLQYLSQLRTLGYQLVTLINPRAYVSSSAKIGQGSIVEPNVVVHSNVSVGVGCLISAGAVVNHNALVEDGCHIDCNVTVPARSVVKAGSKVECGQVYKSEAEHV